MKIRKSLCLLMAFIFCVSITANTLASPLETLMGLAVGEKAEVPIVMYHALVERPDNKWEITTKEFEDDLKYLTENGYTAVVMRDLIDFVYDGKPLPEKPIVLSFDDGRSPTIDIVLPLLEKYGAKITMAIIGIETDNYTKIDQEGIITRHPHMTWQQVDIAVKSGLVEIQSHTYDLHGRDGAKRKKHESEENYRKRLLSDLRKFAEVLHENAGITPNTLVYPLGAISSSSDDIIKEAGYLASMSCSQKSNVITVGDKECLYSLNRYLRPPNLSAREVFAKFEQDTMMTDE